MKLEKVSITIENELHFLIECPFYDYLRRIMLHKAQLCNTDFVAYNSTKKVIFLMNHINMQPIVASTMHDMFQRRKKFINTISNFDNFI